ncbi:hypothetical protein [Tateyamaria sp. SN3-11]|uniref:hypothetical protein n=1 Tax=Tateyamaria sp. SN3-11 TaxID=3092147 RepID=UPI0039EB2441
MTISDSPAAALSHVRWIGGGSGAAKSTVARRLAAAHDAVLYDSDAAMRAHANQCRPEDCPRLAAFKAMDMDERWVNRTPEIMLDSFHWFAGEGFDLIIDDLRALPQDRPILAEGFRLLPRLVAPLLQDKSHATWLLPTPCFRRRAFDGRDTTWDIPRQTRDPERALENLLARDALFTERLRSDVSALGLHSIDVDGTLGKDALFQAVDRWLFG